MKPLARFSTIRLGALILGIIICQTLTASAFDNEPGTPKSARQKSDSSVWLLRPVVLKSLQTDLMVDGKPVPMPDGRAFQVFWVEKTERVEKGERLWVEAGSLKGWVNADEVIEEFRAEANFTQQIQLKPASAELYYLRGLLGREGNLADLDQAIRLDPKLTAAYVARAALHSANKNSEQAIADLSEVIRLEPGRTNGNLLRASEYQTAHQTERAIADCEAVLKIDPMNWETYSIRAGIYYERKAWDRCILDFSEALRLSEKDDPKLSDRKSLYEFRAQAYDKLKDYDRAIADYTEAVRLAELEPEPRLDEWIIFASLYNQADDYDLKRDYNRAIAGFDEAIAHASTKEHRALAYTGRAIARKHLNDFDGALADYARALQIDQSPVVGTVAHLNRARIMANRNQVADALAEADQGVAALPARPLVYVFRAGLLVSLDRFERALADCDRALGIDPKNVPGLSWQAWIWATCPEAKFLDGQKAVESATTACELSGWKEAGCLTTLAVARAEVGDFDSAIRWQKKALELTTDEEDRAWYRELLNLFGQKRPYRDRRAADGTRRAGLKMPEIPLSSR